MKPKVWTFIVGSVLVLSLASFLFLFRENTLQPKLGEVPFIFWSSFLLTVLIVALTYLGSRFFPYKEDTGK